jgi:hypothetical protein
MINIVIRLILELIFKKRHMFEELNAHRQAVAENIKKAFDEDIEKSHQDGDIHPKHPDWVWVSSANRGKGDWRTIKGTVKTAANSKTDTNKKTDKDDTEKKKLEDAVKEAQRIYEREGGSRYLSNLDYAKQKLADFKRKSGI